jgi:hypothetical protein
MAIADRTQDAGASAGTGAGMSAHEYFCRFFRSKSSLDFEKIVTAVLGTFTVFTGFVFSGYLKDLPLAEGSGWLGWLAWFGEWRLWALFALMALLLRYIMGSAVHLNFMYVPPKDAKDAAGRPRPSRSQSVVLLFKDLGFLVLFGVVAMSIASAVSHGPDQGPEELWWRLQDLTSAASHDATDAAKLDTFMYHAMLFVLAGFSWSVADCVLRRVVWVGWLKRPSEGPGYFWLIWCVLDALQFFVTLAISLLHPADPLWTAITLAIVYVAFLFLDVVAMVRNVKATTEAEEVRAKATA